MTNNTITFKFLQNGFRVRATLKADLRLGHVYIFDIPREDLTWWADASVEITISDNKDPAR